MTTPIPTTHGDVHLTDAELRKIAQDNPGVDVQRELKRLRAWLLEPGRSLPAVSAVRGVVGAWMAKAGSRGHEEPKRKGGKRGQGS